jgi:glycosyltransferase involved in cell wall biosynthesis
MTGMGLVVPIGDADALADALLEIFANPEKFKGNPTEIARTFEPRANAQAYEKLYRELLNELGD